MNQRTITKIFNGYINTDGEIVPTNGPIAWDDNTHNSLRISSDSVYTVNTLGNNIQYQLSVQDTTTLVTRRGSI